MPEKTKQEKDSRKCEEKEREDFRVGEESVEDENTWSRDQQEKSYYYDDAYGYEIYNPEDDDDAESC